MRSNPDPVDRTADRRGGMAAAATRLQEFHDEARAGREALKAREARRLLNR